MMPRFVLVGLAAEFSLRPLGAALSARGLPVSMVDLADAPADAAVVPPGEGPVVLVSSQHLAMTGAVYDAHSGTTSHYAAAQVLKSRLAADLLVYVPHDLVEPILPSEVGLLGTYDLYAAPDVDCWWASAHVKTVVTGWVGSAWSDDAALACAPLSRGVFFLTQVRWLMEQGGASFVLSAFANTLDSGIAVKLPVWPGLEPFVEALRAGRTPIVDPQLSAAGIARRTPLVVTNGPSSVLAEAITVGHRPVCVLPPEGDRVFAGQLGSLDVAVCRDADFAATVPNAGVVRRPSPSFDVDALLAAIDETLGERAR